MATPLINGAAYDWASLSLVFSIPGADDIDIYDFTKVEYKEERPVTNNYGQGIYPVSWGRQNVTASATITISTAEFHKLEDLAEQLGLNSIFDLPKFDVVVNFITADGKTRTDVIKNCHITANGRSYNQNDPNSYVDVELNPSHVEWNA